ncbi:MAG: TerC family protein [Polyangiaceae bacterium]|nr:TerC family protein [Polyangiaceae bacterium]
MIELLSNPETYVSLLTLTAMEVVLGIDNIVFISILAGKLPQEEQPSARRIGLLLALVLRIGLLFAISWVMGLTVPLFSVAGHGFAGRNLILLTGGLFLIGKATHEIHDKFEATDDVKAAAPSRGAFWAIIAQIIVLDAVFSIDSVITAVGMVDEISIMVVATLISVGVMLAFAAPIGNFVQRHPSMKVLALSFLILIGVLLVAEGMGQHIAKGYVYFAMAFSLVVELLNMRLRTKSSAVSGGPTTKV